MWLSTTWCDFSVSPPCHGDDVTFPAWCDLSTVLVVLLSLCYFLIFIIYINNGIVLFIYIYIYIYTWYSARFIDVDTHPPAVPGCSMSSIHLHPLDRAPLVSRYAPQESQPLASAASPRLRWLMMTHLDCDSRWCEPLRWEKGNHPETVCSLSMDQADCAQNHGLYHPNLSFSSKLPFENLGRS